MKIITGIGRSGTSAIAKYCQEIGLNIGESKWIEEYKAGFEDKETIQINDHLKTIGFEERIIRRMKDLDRDVVKDPRFVGNTKYIEYWWMVRKDIRVIYLRRDAREIVKSQRSKPEMTCPTYRCFEDLIIEKEYNFLKKLVNLNIPHTIWDYPEITRQPGLVIQEFGGNIQAFNKVIQKR